MADEFGLEDHLKLAKQLNGRVWELLQSDSLTQDQQDEMRYAAYASCYHWLNAGTAANHQRAEWLISRVHIRVNEPASALRHASRCLALTEAHSSEMEDFDVAYAFEAMARASALAGNLDSARRYYGNAEETGAKIRDDEDREIFMNDLRIGEWFGLKK